MIIFTKRSPQITNLTKKKDDSNPNQNIQEDFELRNNKTPSPNNGGKSSSVIEAN